MFKKLEDRLNMLKQMKYLKDPIKLSGMKTNMSVIKNTLYRINILDTTGGKKKSSDIEDTATEIIHNETERKKILKINE